MDEKNKPKTLKKEAKQERSKQIVTSILDGATRVLSSIPLSEATTKKIAEIAGVGIGSLYDYFPDKKSIAVSLIDRRVKQSIEDFSSILKDPKHKSLEETAQAVTEYLMTEVAERRNFLREIFLLAPESGRVEMIFYSRLEMATKVEEYLSATNKKYTEGEIKEKSFLCVHAVLGIIEGYIITEPVTVSRETLAKTIHRIIKEMIET